MQPNLLPILHKRPNVQTVLIRGPREEAGYLISLRLEVAKGQPERRVGLSVKEVSEADVVGNECNNNTDSSTSLADSGGSVDFTGSKECEGESKEPEEEDEGDALANGDNAEPRGDHAPTDEIDAKSACELSLHSVGSTDARTRNQDCGIGKPESTVGSEGCSTESVALGELPHASEELSETTTEDGHANNDVGVSDGADLEVVHREHESCRCERKETQGCGVGNARWHRGGKRALCRGVSGLNGGTLLEVVCRS
jgi:hypothetical protein